jgi:hypothetical protein
VTALGRLGDILGFAARMHGLPIGTVTGVLGDARLERVLGVEVTGTDGNRRFLPWVAVTVREGAVVIDSALVLFESGELDGYPWRGAVVVRDPIRLAGLAVGAGGGITRQEGDRGVSLRGAPGMQPA